MIQETSLEAYMDIHERLGDMQRMILNTIKVYPGVSNKDLSCILNLPINSITPRVKELRAYGMVEFSHYKIDRRTRKRVMTWEAVM